MLPAMTLTGEVHWSLMTPKGKGVASMNDWWDVSVRRELRQVAVGKRDLRPLSFPVDFSSALVKNVTFYYPLMCCINALWDILSDSECLNNFLLDLSNYRTVKLPEQDFDEHDGRESV